MLLLKRAIVNVVTLLTRAIHVCSGDCDVQIFLRRSMLGASKAVWNAARPAPFRQTLTTNTLARNSLNRLVRKFCVRKAQSDEVAQDAPQRSNPARTYGKANYGLPFSTV
jgi:hypothetical protein